MKNSFQKLALPLILSSTLFFNSQKSLSQDFLPGKFENYNDKKEIVGYYCFPFDKEHFADIFLYDIDKDSIADVVELSLSKFQGDSLINSKYPLGYTLIFDNKNPKYFFDPKMDGWNQNEIFLKEDKFDYSKTIL